MIIFIEIVLSKQTTSSRLSNMFLDPLGQHILLSFSPLTPENSPELIYLSRKTSKLKAIVKCRGYDITSVGWNYANESETSTGPILLGTSKGLIFETEINQEEDKFFQSSLEQYWRQVSASNDLISVIENSCLTSYIIIFQASKLSATVW